MALQDLAAKAEELQEMRISKAAVMESAEKEKETVESLRADVSQLQSDKVNPPSGDGGKKYAACALAMVRQPYPCCSFIKLLTGMQATLKQEAAAEKEKIIKQSADIAQQSIITQQARFDAEMGIMKNRLAHESVSHFQSFALYCWYCSAISWLNRLGLCFQSVRRLMQGRRVSVCGSLSGIGTEY